MISSRLFLAPIFAMLLASAVAAQGTGQSLCSGGTRDGGNCLTDTDCNGSGVCVVTQGICDGGGDTGLDCDCPAAACVIAPACVDDPTAGTCSGGPYQGQCCDTLFNCADAAPCRGTQKICNAGEFKGLACLRDADCPGGACTSSGKLCASDRYPCFDDSDCVNVNDTCVGPGFITPTASPTAIGSTPTPTPTVTPGGPACVGDCGGSGDVTVDELLRLVNIALDNIAVTNCPPGDSNGDGQITIDEILLAVNNALNGCPAVTAGSTIRASVSSSQPPRLRRRRH